jgi:acyl dehydratase
MAEKLAAEMNVGDRFETEARSVTSPELDTFCNIAGLKLGAFLNDDVARGMGFNGRVVPGAYGFGLVFALMGERLEGHIHIGTNNLKVLAPLYPDDTVRAEVEILGKKESSKGDRTFVTWGWTLKNQEDATLMQGENT